MADHRCDNRGPALMPSCPLCGSHAALPGPQRLRMIHTVVHHHASCVYLAIVDTCVVCAGSVQVQDERRIFWPEQKCTVIYREFCLFMSWFFCVCWRNWETQNAFEEAVIFLKGYYFYKRIMLLINWRDENKKSGQSICWKIVHSKHSESIIMYIYRYIYKYIYI